MVGKNGKKSVRILLVGDSGVGKTSLIFSLVSEEFPDEVPARAEEITIPPDVTPERIATQIVDYSAQEQSQDILIQEIEKANVICIVYSVDDDETIDKITSYWLPFIRDRLGEEHNTPVVLVGNKADLVEYSSLEVVLPIMNQYCEVETCVECSAKTLKNISELFYYAQKAVLHPTAPLYSPELRDLTERCKRGLTRIFKLCDLDNDGILNDQELHMFQRRCFDTPLQPLALEDVKNIVKRSIPDGVFDNGLTLAGFLYLHTLFIQRGRHETTWTVLRKFGYNDSVLLDNDYTKPKLNIPSGCSAELTILGYNFLKQLFQKYDKDNDGALSPIELQNLFSVCDKMPLWCCEDDISAITKTNDNGWITLNGFLAIWTLITALDVNETFEYFAYLGYIAPPEENQFSSVCVTRDKRIDLQKRQTSRNVFSCHLIGPEGAGKTSFMRGFLGKNLLQHRSKLTKRKASQFSNFVVNNVQVYGQEKYLIIKETDILSLTDNIPEPELVCDVVCLMYDSTDTKSFEYIARIYLKNFIESKLPVIIVAAKSDEVTVRQNYTLQPDEFCAKHKLPPPHYFSVNKEEISKEVYVKLGTVAAYPNLRRLVHVLLMRPTSSVVSQYFSNIQNCLGNDTVTWFRAGVGLATLAIVSLFIIKLMKTTTSSTSR